MSPSALRDYIKKYPEMREAWKTARSRCQAWWIARGANNIANPNFNTGLYCFMMANLFGWRRTDQSQELRLSGGTRTDHHFHVDMTKINEDGLDKLESARRVVASIVGSDRGRTLLPKPR